MTRSKNLIRWEKTKEIFDAALALPEQERQAYLFESTAGDSDLRADVEELLAADAEAGGFLDSPWAVEPQPVVEQLPHFHPGDMISSRFRVMRLLGNGGMGQVYQAYDSELGVSVALKTIRPEIATNPEIVARFRQEVRLARRITHPNVCRTFDMQRDAAIVDPATGRSLEITYLTMEYLEGESLREALKRKGRLSVDEALDIARQIALALTAAHETGVVHRDVKPANVMIVPRLEGCRVVVTDFGLARLDALGEAGELSAISQTGRVVGTLAYMAPEQLEGGQATAASDIYAFGLVLYEMVTGSKAFPENGPLGGVWKRLAGPPPSPRALVPELSEAWVGTILRCLQVKPQDRFPSVSALIAQLVGSSTLSIHPSRIVQGYASSEKASLWHTRRWWIVGICVILVCVSLFVFRSRLHSTGPDAKVAPGAMVFLAGVQNDTGERSLDNLEELLRGQLVQSVQFNLLDRGTVADMLQLMTRNPGTSIDDRTAREIALRSGAMRIVRGTVSASGKQHTLQIRIEEPDSQPDRARHTWKKEWSWEAGSSGPEKGEIPESLLEAVRDAGAWVRSQAGEAANDLARLDAPPQDVTTSSWDALAEYTHAEELASRGKDDDAIASLKNAVQLDPQFALAYARIGDILVSQEHAVDGYEAYSRSLSAGMARRLSRRERDRIKGMYALDSGDLQAADVAFRDYIAYYENDPLGWAYRVYPLEMLGRTDEALAALHRDLELRPEWKFALTETVKVLLLAQRYDEAQQALDHVRHAGFVDDAAELDGSLQFLLGHYDKAESSFVLLSHAKDQELRWRSFRLRARLAAERGDASTALRLLQEGASTAGRDSQISRLLDRAAIHVRVADNAALLLDVKQALSLQPSQQNVIAISSLLGEAFTKASAGSQSLLRQQLNTLPNALPKQDAGVISELARLRVDGEIRLAGGDWKEALDSFRRAANLDAPAGSRGYLGRVLAIAASHQGDVAATRQMNLEAMQAYAAVALRPGFIWQDPIVHAPGFYADQLEQFLRLASQTESLSPELRSPAQSLRRLRSESVATVPGLRKYLEVDVSYAGEPKPH
ncbi:serine/threonine-protein kinase [Granulicella arctica]|uniref:serine/threonine-protein kinase n=1 Tax=Granulicella arctica TaxID=940613 RepID=UPI0021E04D43|nr:serine/threonine-protein kinase [Granulicella arctica]